MLQAGGHMQLAAVEAAAVAAARLVVVALPFRLDLLVGRLGKVITEMPRQPPVDGHVEVLPKPRLARNIASVSRADSSLGRFTAREGPAPRSGPLVGLFVGGHIQLAGVPAEAVAAARFVALGLALLLRLRIGRDRRGRVSNVPTKKIV